MLEMFITMTISIVVGMLLASVIAMFIMLNPKVMKLYLKYMMKCIEAVQDFTLNDLKEELEELEESK